MEISEQRLREFIKIYEDEFGEELSVPQARAMATRLVYLYTKLIRPLPDERQSGDDGDIGDVARG